MTDPGDRLVVDVEGIRNREVADSVAAAIRESLRDRWLAAQWHVRVRPSVVCGRWDINLHGLGARHGMSIALPETSLAQHVAHRLRESFDRLRQRRLNELHLRIVGEN